MQLFGKLCKTMKYEIHPANGAKCIAEKVIDLRVFLVLPSSVFKVVLHY